MQPYFRKTIHSTERISNLLSDFLAKNPSFGTLFFQVWGPQGAFPIANATVTLTKDLGDGQQFSFTALTDENGKTTPLSLPAPSRTLSQKPGSGNVFSVYQAKVSAPGYLPISIHNLPVFDGVTTIQPVNLSPDFGQTSLVSEIIDDKMPEL